MENNPLRLVIDTNLWISFIVSNKLDRLENFLIDNKAKILLSEELINEIASTIAKPRLKKYFPEDALAEMLDVFEPFSDFIEIKSKVEVCRDPNDDFLLSLAKDGKADYLLTGDKDLLVLEVFEGTKIMKINDFFEKYPN